MQCFIQFLVQLKLFFSALFDPIFGPFGSRSLHVIRILDTCSLGFFSNKPSFVQTSRKLQQMSCPTRKLQQMGFGCKVASTIPMGLASQTAVKVVQLLWELQHRELEKLYNSYANCITDNCKSCTFTMGTTAQRAVKVVQFLCELHHRQL